MSDASTIPVACPRGHGDLVTLSPATLDGSRRLVGGCWTCGGIWVPVEAVPSLFPEALLRRFAESGYKDVGPRCGRCPGGPEMRQQHIQHVEVDRCQTCLALWLDGQEFRALGGGAEAAGQAMTCDVCALELAPFGNTVASTVFGRVCPPCVTAAPLVVSTEVHLSLGMGGEKGDRIITREVLGASVRSTYDEEGSALRWQFTGELHGCPVRGSLTHENRLSRMLRAIGVSDLESGVDAFDDVWLVRAERDDPMLAFLDSPGVTDHLMTLHQRVGATVLIGRDHFTCEGNAPAGGPVPDQALEDAADALYLALRQER